MELSLDFVLKEILNIKREGDDWVYFYTIGEKFTYNNNYKSGFCILSDKFINSIKEDFEKARPFSQDKVFIEKSNYYEVGIESNDINRVASMRKNRFLRNFNQIIDENDDRIITYDIGYPSLKYIFSIIKTLNLNDNFKSYHMHRLMRHEVMRSYRSNRLEMHLLENKDSLLYEKLENLDTDDQKAITDEIIENIMMIFRMFTLKLNITSGEVDASFSEIASSFLFTMSLKGYDSFKIVKEIKNLFNLNYSRHSILSKNKMQPPRRIYNTELVSMYINAKNSKDNYGSFLGYYHILEYFFDKVFKEFISKKIQDTITDPHFSYTNIDNLYDLGKQASKDIDVSRNGDAGNELSSLKYLLRKYISENDLEGIKKQLGKSLVKNVFSSKKPSFVKKCPNINFNDLEDFINTVSSRIYKVRNSLVHTKSEYLHYDDKKNHDELINEINLVRVISEKIMVNSSKLLE